MALWRRDRAGTPAGPGLVHHSDAGSQYTSFAFTAHLLEAGIDASIGTVGDALDNALMESQIGLYKTELIKPRKPWHSLADVELATAEWVDWFSNQRLHTAIGDIPPHTSGSPGARFTGSFRGGGRAVTWHASLPSCTRWSGFTTASILAPSR